MISFKHLSEKAKKSIAQIVKYIISDKNEKLPPIFTSEQENQAEIQILKQLRVAEAIAHKLAYEEHAESGVISLLEEDEVKREYLCTRLKSGHNGVVGFIYTPTALNNASRIYVNFRGTHNLASMHAGFERSAGEKSFHHCLGNIINQLSHILSDLPAEKKKNLEIIFAGHSLGACYAQYALNACMQLQAQNLLEDLASVDIDRETQLSITIVQEEWQRYLHETYQLALKPISREQRRVFNTVLTFKIFSWSAPGVSKFAENLSNILANILKQNGKKIVGRFAIVDKDDIQRLGASNILLGCHAADTALLEMFEGKAISPQTSPYMGNASSIGAALLGVPGVIVGGTIDALSEFLHPILEAHKAYLFTDNEIGSNHCFRITRGHTPMGREYIEEQLRNKKWGIMQNGAILGAKAVFCEVGEVGAKIKKLIGIKK